ncbi:hypothetical protein CONLIGDRAFT_635073 [Coniochaeta ligniaria NRRL 30616]|uniref:Uncharacterized protein n=1 Tax=Coniochaeta ligniaria NRRL 30616 TaxID=1408157 RepID=A0A1J7JC48_9PEZI|nr:hypothetical protein CONLIGDRAFT_635073 [Coniochaeta ligniaria NRRL 30616]
MFGSFAHIIPPAATAQSPPKDVPPPTPINFPSYVPDDDGEAAAPKGHISAVLQGIHRPTEVTVSHLQALGVHVIQDASPADVIGDTAVLPDFEAWDKLTPDEAHAANESTKKPMNNRNSSPGCIVYLDRKRELSIPNEAAYRAVRRIQPPPGQSQARLGNSYEFYRYLEMFSAFWDDTSKPPTPEKVDTPKADDGSKEESGTGSDTADSPDKAPEKSVEASVTYRTGSGSQMPPDCRQNILSSFLKLVAYDFGCNVSAPRTEPRLYVSSPATPDHPARNSYFSSGCTFIFRTPTTREAARAGIVEGPLAAVSARHTTSFAPSSPGDRDATMDLSRELIAALLTAQHRRRAGKTERRIGEDAWWATKPRWGGGPGGPIGREIEMLTVGADAAVGDKDALPESPPEDSPMAPAASLSSPYPPAGASDGARPRALPSRLAGSGAEASPKGAKRLKKSGNGNTLPMYDNYRMVRPPSAAWDKKTRYEAVGRRRGADYDDVFVVSSLFHHISVLRVRVPDRLLEALEGGVYDAGEEERKRSWGRLEVWRSKWYDFFLVEDRVEAMRLVWGMMAYLMREEEEGSDVKMQNA